MDRNCAITARGIGRRFGRFWALAHVDLDAQEGEGLLLAGRNGAGKTTLLRVLAGLLRPTLGEMRLFGEDLTRRRLEWRRTISVVSHHSYLYEHLAALEMVRVWARLLGREADDRHLMSLLDEVDLGKRHATPISGFSAGMRKRLTLVRTRLENPRIVLLDEPFASLDEAGQRLIETWIRDFRSRGVTVVMASHALARAAALCSQAYLLEQGQVAWRGPANELAGRLEATA